MATRVTRVLIDDIDKSEADETVSFGLDGVKYEIDLNSTHAAELRHALSRWVDAGRRVVGGRRHRSTGAPVNMEMREFNRKVRAWAQQSGRHVSDRGRVSAALIAAYRDATGDQTLA